MNQCTHPNVFCINPYELIRKYHCQSCGGIMMCACDEEFARRFLPHQLREGTELKTQRSIPVTLGFQTNICNTCRGLPEEPYPRAEIYGRASKIQRYYWREIFFETTNRFANWAESQGYDYDSARSKYQDSYNDIEKEVIEEIKLLHKRFPKYTYLEEPANEVLTKNGVKVINLNGTYINQEERKVRLLEADKILSAEEFAASYYSKQDYEVLFLESTPFHALFGVFMWLLIQDLGDMETQIVMFGDRQVFDEDRKGREVRTHLPNDFGTSGYAQRRASAIEKHLAFLPKEKEELLWTFDYWVKPSEGLRQYLWAHRAEDLEKARKMVTILPPNIIHRILRYLVADYWGRYLGWPDLLVYKPTEYLFVEVKSSKDRLRENQKKWIYGNASEICLPFEMVKIHRLTTKPQS